MNVGVNSETHVVVSGSWGGSLSSSKTSLRGRRTRSTFTCEGTKFKSFHTLAVQQHGASGKTLGEVALLRGHKLRHSGERDYSLVLMTTKAIMTRRLVFSSYIDLDYVMYTGTNTDF